MTSVVWIGRAGRLKADTPSRCAIRDAAPSDLPALRRLSEEGSAIRFALTTGLRIDSTTNDFFRWLE